MMKKLTWRIQRTKTWEGNTMGNARAQRAIDALVLQTKSIEKVVAASGLKTATFNGSHSLDNPNAVFK